MERAGTAAAELAARLASDKQKDVLVLAGPGNNGGDAKVVARLLREQFFRVTLLDSAQLPEDKAWGLVVDGLFGIGLARDIEGDYARLVEYVNHQSCPVLALDIPSGLHSDTGRVMGRAVRATHTITVLGLKPGLLTLDGPDHCGDVTLADLGLPAQRATAWIASPDGFGNVLKPRPRNFHKGMAASPGTLGGAPRQSGPGPPAGGAAPHVRAGRGLVGIRGDPLH